MVDPALSMRVHNELKEGWDELWKEEGLITLASMAPVSFPAASASRRFSTNSPVKEASFCDISISTKNSTLVIMAE